MKKLHPFMLAGTGSDVGKSVLAAGLCRILRQDGYHPAPFKAQNMSLNSYATPDGLEIGRAQAVQAEAAGIPCHTDMNPVLLKPNSDHSSQLVLHGRPVGNREAYDYFHSVGREDLRREVCGAFDRLQARYNPVVMEGAGSVAEINLGDMDIVNMPMARHAGADVFLVADIERGGVFASAYGSIMLQKPEDRARIKGIIVNKFRGDLRLFQPGIRMMEETCGVPVLGVVPYFHDICIEEEDSVDLIVKSSSAQDGKVNVAVVRLRHLSNFTDFDSLERDARVHLYYADSAEMLRGADIIILPGSKNTVADLEDLERNGMAEAVVQARRGGKTVVGICGGYQMMGVEIADPEGVEGSPGRKAGLGLLPVCTVFGTEKEKVTRRVKFRGCGTNVHGEGYEIHMGRTFLVGDAPHAPLVRLEDGGEDGYLCGDKCMGTYLHGIFDNRSFVDFMLAPYLGNVAGGDTEDYVVFKERQYDLLADYLRRYLDMAAIYRILSEER